MKHIYGRSRKFLKYAPILLFFLFFLLLSFNIKQIDLLTSVECKGSCCQLNLENLEELNNRTCLYRNLYLFDGMFFFFSDKKHFPNKLDVVVYENREIDTSDDKHPYNKKFVPEFPLPNLPFVPHEALVVKGVSVLINTIDLNFGHGMLDDGMSAYNALLKFGLGNEKFHFILKSQGQPSLYRYSLHDVLYKFSGLDPFFLATANRTQVYRFERLVVGRGPASSGYLSNDYVASSRHRDLFLHYRNRMYKTFSVSSPVKSRPIRALFIQSNRGPGNSEEELRVWIAEAHPDVEFQYRKWEDFLTFEEELRVLSSTDILFVGPGTASKHFVFMRNETAFVHLGERHPALRQSDPPTNYTGYKDDQITTAVFYVRSLFYPRYSSSELATGKPLMSKQGFQQIFGQAYGLVKDGFLLPVAPSQNMSPVAPACIEAMRVYPLLHQLVNQINKNPPYGCNWSCSGLLFGDEPDYWGGACPEKVGMGRRADYEKAMVHVRAMYPELFEHL